MSPFIAFLLGFFGSVAADVVSAVCSLQPAPHRLSRLYSKGAFYVTHLLLAVVAGILAAAYQPEKPLMAFGIGAAAPIIVQRFPKFLKLV